MPGMLKCVLAGVAGVRARRDRARSGTLYGLAGHGLAGHGKARPARFVRNRFGLARCD